jgi:hypothetical protein
MKRLFTPFVPCPSVPCTDTGINPHGVVSAMRRF